MSTVEVTPPGSISDRLDSMQDNFSHVPILNHLTKALRLAFIPAIALLTAGGSIISSNTHLGRTLSMVGYIVFAVVLVGTIVMQLYIFTIRSTILPASRKVR